MTDVTGQASPKRLPAFLSVSRLSLGRAAVGGVMLARPGLLPRSLGVDSASAARTAWVVQMLGAREVALGLGTWVARRRGDRQDGRLWVVAGMCADAVDALAVGAALRGRRVSAPAGAAVVATAAGAALLGAADLLRR